MIKGKKSAQHKWQHLILHFVWNSFPTSYNKANFREFLPETWSFFKMFNILLQCQVFHFLVILSKRSVPVVFFYGNCCFSYPAPQCYKVWTMRRTLDFTVKKNKKKKINIMKTHFLAVFWQRICKNYYLRSVAAPQRKTQVFYMISPSAFELYSFGKILHCNKQKFPKTL